MVMLQLALDGDLDAALRTLEVAHDQIDIAELGTPLIYREGMRAAQVIRDRFPKLTLLADLKIMDAGEHEARIAFEADCQMVTVLAVTDDATVAGTVKAARAAGGQVVVDMMHTPRLEERARRLVDLGCDILCLHTGWDSQRRGANPLAGLETLRATLPEAKLAAAGGLTLETLTAVLALKPAIVVVGGAITQAADPAQTARLFRERMGV